MVGNVVVVIISFVVMVDMTYPVDPMTIFISEAFIEEMQGRPGGAGCEAFLTALFTTQLWAAHSDEKRTRADFQRRNSVLNARMLTAGLHHSK